MIECITIASWMLAVVGAAILCASIFSVVLHCERIEREEIEGNVFIIVVVQMFGLVGGAVMFGYYIIPYIPHIVWPCMQVIP